MAKINILLQDKDPLSVISQKNWDQSQVTLKQHEEDIIALKEEIGLDNVWQHETDVCIQHLINKDTELQDQINELSESSNHNDLKHVELMEKIMMRMNESDSSLKQQLKKQFYINIILSVCLAISVTLIFVL